MYYKIEEIHLTVLNPNTYILFAFNSHLICIKNNFTEDIFFQLFLFFFGIQGTFSTRWIRMEEYYDFIHNIVTS